MTTRASTLAVLTAGLLVAASPGAAAPPAPEGAVRLEPNIAGRGSALVVDVDPRSAGSGTQTPNRLSVLFQRGFRFDTRARAGRCSDQQARNVNCPDSSRIGRGTADGTATFVGGSANFTATIELFLARPRNAGDIVDVVVEVREPQSGTRRSARGRLRKLPSGTFGAELLFNPSAAGAPPPGVTIQVRRLRLRVGATRSVTSRRGGRTITRRHHLITNPRTCTGEWLIRLRARYSGGRQVARDATPACRSS